MSVNIIVAVGNYVPNHGFPIGIKGNMPWNNKADLKWFKNTTTGHPVIMGRKTFEAIGHPLPNRTNIVVTSRNEYEARYKDVKVVSDVEEAIGYAKTIDDEIFIIGGASIYDYALSHNYVDKVLIDMLAVDVPDADTFFPDIVTNPNWEEIGQPIEIEHRKAYAMTYIKCNGLNNHVDEQYLNLVNDIIEHGEIKDTRAGKTRSLFGKQLRFNLKEGLPILTTKKVFTKGIIHELLWFLKGETNIKYLVENGVHIWDDDAYRYYLELTKNNTTPQLSKNDFLSEVLKQTKIYPKSIEDNLSIYKQYVFGDLGPVYGKQWRNWNGVDQINELINKLKTNPDDRRLIVSAWNVGELKTMALPPCHYCCQFYTKKMTFKEREQYVVDNYADGSVIWYPDDEERSNRIFDNAGVPTRKLSCMWNQRSVDCGLGLPYNITSYSIMTYMIAQCCNMGVDELIFSGGDVHMYENQIEIYEKEQKNRNPHMYGLPKLWLNPERKNIEEFTYDDIKIKEYQSYPLIKYPLSVGL